MLTGNRKKYRVIIFGVAIASMMMAHQMSVFWGVMRRSVNQILDVHPNGIWVMDPQLQYVDEIKPLQDTVLERVRSVSGVGRAVPLYKGTVRAQTDAGTYRQVNLLGIDDRSLFGAPSQFVLGGASDLRRPEGVVVDEAGYTYLWPGEALRLDKVLELNGRRAVLVGVCKASPPFQSMPIIYARYRDGIRLAPPDRNQLSFVLVEGRPGIPRAELCERIRAQTGLLALTGGDFARKTILYYFRFTGIPINFGIVVSMGFIVGIAIAGQNFYLFAVENLGQFGMLKAMGLKNSGLAGMIILQASVVAILGYGLGMGMVAILIDLSKRSVMHMAGFYLPWQVMVATGLAILMIMVASSLLSIRRVMVQDPVAILRGN